MKSTIQYKDTQKFLDTYSTVWCELLFGSILIRTSKIQGGGYLKYLAALYNKMKTAEGSYYTNIHQPLWNEVRELAGDSKSISFCLKEAEQWLNYSFAPYGDGWSFQSEFLDKAPERGESSFGRKFHNSQERMSQLRRRTWVIQDILKKSIIAFVAKAGKADAIVSLELGGLKHLILAKECGAEFLVWDFRPQELKIS